MTKLLAALALGMAALSVSACDMSGGELMDPVVRSMASDEQIARFEGVIEILRTDDAEALEAILADGFPERFAQQAVDYFPNEQPNAILFTGFNTSTNFSTNGRTRSLNFAATVEFDHGNYMVQTDFAAQDDDPLRLVRLSIVPLFEEAGPEAETDDDPAGDGVPDNADSNAETPEAEMETPD